MAPTAMVVRPDLAPLGPYESCMSVGDAHTEKILTTDREGCELAHTVVVSSMRTARTSPSLLSARPPPEVKKPKFHLDASCSLA